MTADPLTVTPNDRVDVLAERQQCIQKEPTDVGSFQSPWKIQNGTDCPIARLLIRASEVRVPGGALPLTDAEPSLRLGLPQILPHYKIL